MLEKGLRERSPSATAARERAGHGLRSLPQRPQRPRGVERQAAVGLHRRPVAALLVRKRDEVQDREDAAQRRGPQRRWATS